LAAAELSVIKGRLFVGAKLLRALAVKRGYRVVRLESTAELCTALLIRWETGEEIGRTTYTIEEARTAGLIRDSSAWKTHPARMLWARASKFVLDDYAPEVTLGIYTEEEGAEIEPKLFGGPVYVPDDGVVIDVSDEDIPFGELSVEPAEDPP
jgi:hypothetical protein